MCWRAACRIYQEDKETVLRAGACMAVPAGVTHAIGGGGSVQASADHCTVKRKPGGDRHGRTDQEFTSCPTFALKEQVQYEDGKVISLTLAQKPGVGMTLFAFDAGEAISTHAAPGDAMATILEGTAEITVDGTPHT